jgi:DnaJ-class molecular chaperone
MACRGSGQVISNLGGAPSSVTCPWCAGAGVRVPGTDAQARWLEQQDTDGAVPDSAPEPAA